MEIRQFAFVGAALIVIVGSAEARSAQSNAAAERAETRQLNMQQSDMAQSQAQAAAPAAKDMAANLPANAPPAAAPTMMADAAPLPAAAPVAVTPATDTQSKHFVPLTDFDKTPDKLASASVLDESGKPVGAVQKVQLADGKPVKVDVALVGGNNAVSMDASQLSYDADHNVLTARAGTQSAAQTR